jgi:tellurite resistance protein TehA-like permease
VAQTKAAFRQQKMGQENDTHNKLMSVYPDIPEWIYAAWLLAMSALTVLVCIYTPFHMPWWASIFGIGMGVVMTIPIGIIQAVSGTQIGLNVLTELVIGMLLTGQTIPVICFKSLSYNVLIQALSLVGDLKLGHSPQ